MLDKNATQKPMHKENTGPTHRPDIYSACMFYLYYSNQFLMYISLIPTGIEKQHNSCQKHGDWGKNLILTA